MIAAVHCFIYKSPKKEEMYLYLNQKDCFEAVPEALLVRFGSPVFIMELELTAERKLARESSLTVIENLHKQGFHLQMPANLKPDIYHGNQD
jgi:hypothetical protein